MTMMRMVSTVALSLFLASTAACLDGGTITTSLGGGDDGGGDDAEACHFTQGYWKNHPEAWPVDSLTLGDVTYSKDELLEIFDEQPAQGNGLVSLAHQLIAAKLNVAAGAPDGDISDEIEAADDLIGSLVIPPIGDGFIHSSMTSALNDALTDFNELGAADCEPEPECGDDTLDEGEECDDGNNEDGDGCSAECEKEEDGGECGDRILDEGEECDDGNNEDGDGCSAECETEEDGGECGDRILDEGEECDDGNTMDGDGCSANCTTEMDGGECGNGELEPGEECDDGNDDDSDFCSNDCKIITG